MVLAIGLVVATLSWWWKTSTAIWRRKDAVQASLQGAREIVGP